MHDDKLTSTETAVGAIWAELLHLDKTSANDNFFEMGGDSITALTMLFRVGDIFGTNIRFETVMDAPTLSEFCRIIDIKKSESLKTIEKSSDFEENAGIQSVLSGASQCDTNDPMSSVIDSSDVETEKIVPCERKDRVTVSFIQEQIVGAELADMYDPDKTRSHCLDLCYRIKGTIDVTALNKAFCEIVQRHEILRTSYYLEDGIIFQNVNDAPQTLLHVEELRSLAQNVRERETERILNKKVAESFSFFRDKLMISATLITDGIKEHVLAVFVNHVAIDGLSMDILRKELFLLYKAFSENIPPHLSDQQIQYTDYAIWEREYFSGDRLDAKLSYWNRLSNEPLNTMLPVDHKPSAISYSGDTVLLTISPELTARLRELARDCKITLFTALFAAFIALIHAFSGYRYNFFCIPVANRSHRGTRSLIGCFMNFQFVYIDLSGNPTFLELIERLHRTLRDVYENYVPFHFITREIPPQGPVVDFQLQPAPDESASPVELSLYPFKLQPQEFALFPIDVRLVDYPETITGHFKYQTAAYNRNTISDMVNDYTDILSMAVQGSDVRLSDMGKPHRSVL